MSTKFKFKKYIQSISFISLILLTTIEIINCGSYVKRGPISKPKSPQKNVTQIKDNTKHNSKTKNTLPQTQTKKSSSSFIQDDSFKMFIITLLILIGIIIIIQFCKYISQVISLKKEKKAKKDNQVMMTSNDFISKSNKNNNLNNLNDLNIEEEELSLQDILKFYGKNSSLKYIMEEIFFQIKFENNETNFNQYGNLDCSICQEKINKYEENGGKKKYFSLVKGHCEHVFHIKCIKQFIKEKIKKQEEAKQTQENVEVVCPSCNQSLLIRQKKNNSFSGKEVQIWNEEGNEEKVVTVHLGAGIGNNGYQDPGFYKESLNFYRQTKENDSTEG